MTADQLAELDDCAEESGLGVEMPELHEYPRFDNEPGHHYYGPDE